jgi:hypothetical protein
MNEAKQLFQDIKSIFVKEGVDVEKQEMNTDPETVVNEAETTTEETPETVTEKFEDITLADGSVAQVEPDVSLGAAMVVQIDEELLPAPDGEHELSDGRIVTTESGIIVDIKEVEETPEMEEEEEEMEKESPFTEAQEREAKKIIESIVTERVFGMESTLAEETELLKNDIIDLKNAFHKLVELTEKLVNEPTTESLKKNKSGFQNLKKDKKTDLIEKLKSKNIIN